MRESLQSAGERGGFQAAVHGVAGLGVAALKVEQVAGLETHAGAGQAHAGGGERAQPRSQRRGEAQCGTGIVLRVVAHAVSSLSGWLASSASR